MATAGSGSGSASAVVDTPAPPVTPLVLADKARFVLGADGPRHADDAEMVVFSADGHRLASIDQHGTAFIWDVTTGVPIERKTSGSITYRPSIAFGPGGTLVIRAYGDQGTSSRSDDDRWLLGDHAGKPALLEISTGRWQPFDHPEPFGFSLAGGTIASIAEDRTVTAGPIGGASKTLVAGTERTYVVVVAPDGTQVASANEHDSDAIRVHSIAGGAPRAIKVEELADSGSGVTAMTWTADSTRLAVAVHGRAIAIVDVRRGTSKLIARDAFANDITSLAFSPNGRWVVGGTKYGRVRLWDATTGALSHRHTGHIGTAWDVAISDDGKTIASAGDERALLWTPESSTVATEYGDHEHWVHVVTLAADGSQLASCSDYGDINVRALPAGTLTAKLQVKGSDCEALAFRGSSLIAATGTEAQVFPIRDRAAPQVIRLAAGRKYGSAASAISTDGHWFASGGDDGRIAVHALPTGVKRWAIDLPKDREEPQALLEVRALAFDRAAKQLAAVTADDQLRFYDARTGRMIRSHAIRQGCTTGLTFARADRIVVTCTTGDIIAYDTKGAIAFEAKHRDGGVYSLAATDKRLVAGGADGSVTVWDLP